MTKKITESFAMGAPSNVNFRGRNVAGEKLAQILGFFLARSSVVRRKGLKSDSLMNPALCKMNLISRKMNRKFAKRDSFCEMALRQSATAAEAVRGAWLCAKSRIQISIANIGDPS